jgi:hypothetical protein
MTNDLVVHEDEDGFQGGLNSSGRLLKGLFLKWSESTHWIDRDGLTPPSPLLVVAIKPVLQRFKDNKVEIIDTFPLPDPKELNAAIPTSEWQIGLDGKPRPPWQHTVVVYLVNLATAQFYTYANATIGAHIAYDNLKEAVITMRALRGSKVMPLVGLAERPMKTKFGMKTRPHFEILDWKTPGGEDSTALPNKPAPQLPPAAAAAPTTATSATSTASTSTPTTPTPTPPSAQPRQGKPTINLTEETVAAMGTPKPVTTDELLNDSIPF